MFILYHECLYFLYNFGQSLKYLTPQNVRIIFFCERSQYIEKAVNQTSPKLGN